jgi:hypothetical protein
MSQTGQSRRFGDVRATSALPLIADVRCEDQQVRKLPQADSCTAAKRQALFDHFVDDRVYPWRYPDALAPKHTREASGRSGNPSRQVRMFRDVFLITELLDSKAESDDVGF